MGLGIEFCLILPDLALDHATSAMEALRDRFATFDDAQSPALSVGLSIGLAAWKPSCTDATQWLDEADRALYEAKSTGRNRVICSGDHEPRQEAFDAV
ncbi:diguanylate cyclase [Pseudomonas sp. PDM04]|nr:diguanylate cyclase [Pseudomonas sp. PDM04]